jgi:hypothetical protein
MNLINVEQLVASLFEQCMDVWGSNPRNIPDTYAQHFCLRLGVENFGYEKDGNTFHEAWKRSYRRYIHVIITSRRNVFVAAMDNPYIKEVDPSLFLNSSNHDSCWRSDGLTIFRRELGKAWDHCYGWMEENPVAKRHLPQTMLSMDIFTTFGEGFISVKPLSFVKVEFGPPDDLQDPYHRKLLSIEPLNFEITFKEVPKKSSTKPVGKISTAFGDSIPRFVYLGESTDS